MDDVVTWLIVMKPFWFLAAWLAGAVFAAFIALEKNRCGLCWFAMGVLFGPLALIATAGLPVKPPRPPAGPKAGSAPAAASPAVHAHAAGHAQPVAHGPAHGHASSHASSHGGAHPSVAAGGPIPPPLSPGHPSSTPAAHATAHAPAAHHVEASHTPAKPGLLESTLERPGGIAIVAVLVLLLLGYFAIQHF
jgi:hypothetical protein